MRPLVGACGLAVSVSLASAAGLFPGNLAENLTVLSHLKTKGASTPVISGNRKSNKLDLVIPQTPVATPPVSAPTTRFLPQPFDSPPWPLADWVTESSSPIGESWDASTGPLQKAIVGNRWDQSRIKFYGWIDLGYTASTSNHNNFPLTYGFFPNRPVLDQLVFKVERMPDTVQTSHPDYGFRFTSLYGTDYRFTAADGYLFDQYQKRNALYGYDPVEMFVQLYEPKVAQGMVVTAGRYISPPDIEAQLAPQNYLYSHSVMFTVDPYTYTGVNALIRWTKTFSTLTGIQAGSDKAPWEKSAQPNAELLFGFHSPSNNDTLWTGLDSIGSGHFRGGHDDLQIFSSTYGHKFSNLWHTYTQFYYMWEYDGAKGGTEIDGPNEPYAGGGGAGPIIPGQSHSIGAVNYLEYKVDKNTYASYRTDFLNDAQGQRTGFVNNYMSFTLGLAHYFTPTTEFRPEVRYDYASKNPAYDNGTRKTQWTLAADLIFHF